MKKLSVSEAFVSIQGEGKTMGRRSVFLRLAGCNLMCGGQGTQFDNELHSGAEWRCDTIEVWMKGKAKAFNDILDKEMLDQLIDGAHLIITGGEPLLQQDAICDFLESLDMPVFVEIETNGTIMPNTYLIERVNQWNISPKLTSSGNGKLGINYDVLEMFNEWSPEKVQFKFVVANEKDIDEIEELDLDPHKIWLMPAGSSQAEIAYRAPEVVLWALEKAYSYSHRLQVSIWNQTTGV